MLVLALDTTTRAGSCALARDGRVVREEASDAARAPASRLPRELEALLDRAGVALHEIDVLAAATGPGSFTGLRIGIATMQGLAMAAGKPLIGVSALDALCACGASPAGSPGEPDPGAPTAPAPWGGVARATKVERIATWIDAWRGEVYSALYESGREVEPPTVARPEALLARLVRPEPGRRAGHPTMFIGDGAAAYRDLILSMLGADARMADPAAPLLAGTIARLATDAARAGHRPPPHAIRPLYVRRPDAERDRAARRS